MHNSGTEYRIVSLLFNWNIECWMFEQSYLVTNWFILKLILRLHQADLAGLSYNLPHINTRYQYMKYHSKRQALRNVSGNSSSPSIWKKPQPYQHAEMQFHCAIYNLYEKKNICIFEIEFSSLYFVTETKSIRNIWTDHTWLIICCQIRFNGDNPD